MKKIGKTFLFATFGLLSNPGFAQLTVSSPVADAANEKTSTSVQGNSKAGKIYGVDLYTGTANISIPIYDYKIDNLNLGVSLNYDTRGQKVDQIASSTGLGFSLSAGGSIERDVFGIDDELTMRALMGTNQYGPTTLVPAQKGYWGWVTAGGPDHEKEYDLFHATIGDVSFQFTITGFSKDNHGNTITHAVTYPKSEIKIDVYEVNPHWPAWGPYPGVPLSSQGAFAGIDDTMSNDYYVCFVITDEKGNRFFFDRGDYELKYYTQDGATNPYYYYSTDNWILRKVVTRTNDTVKYSYNINNYLTYPLAKDEKVREVTAHHEQYGILWDTTYTAHVAKLADSVLYWKGLSTHLSKIEYPDGSVVTINLENSTNSRCDLPGAQIVKSIKVENRYDNNSGNSFLYQFNYAYFKTPDVNNAATEVPYGNCSSLTDVNLRLKLKSIDKIGIDGTTNERYYSFDYNNVPLPQRLSPSRDYYGYYNGATPQFSSTGVSNPVSLSGLSIPLHTYNLSPTSTYTYGVDRTPNINYMQACNLMGVTNSLGGEISFSYKDHSLYNPYNSYGNHTYGNIGTLPTNFQGDNANDGLCIDKIVFSDGFNIDNSYTLKYEFSGGERFFRGGYFWNPQYFVYHTDQFGQDSFTYERNVYTNNYVTPRQFINGANHGYTYAVEKKYGYNNEYMGSVQHKFTNLMDENDSMVSNLMVKPQIIMGGGQTGLRMLINEFHPVYFNQYKMGLELETSTYDINGALLEKTVNTYADNSPLAVNGGFNSRMIEYGAGTDNLVYYSDQYSNFYPKKRWLTSTTTMSYAGSNATTRTTNYSYDTKDNIVSESWADSKGDTFTKKYFYNYSLVNNAPVFDSATFSTDLQYVVISEFWKKISNTDYLLGYNKSNPPGLSGIDVNDYYSLKTDIPVAQAQYANSSFMTSNVTEDKHYRFDDQGNVIEGRYNNGKTYAASIWDTKIGKKIASVTDAKFDQIAYTSFEGGFAPGGTYDYKKGNWDFDPAGVVYSANSTLVKPLTGDYHYQLSTISPITSFNPLQAGLKYRLSFWATSAPTVTSGSQTINLTVTAEKQYWKLYTATISGTGSLLNISATGTSINIDELRLHPFDASMETATYAPLLGQTSKTDNFNNVTYYQYDMMGRVNVVKDRDGNIRSLSKDIVQGTDN